MWSREAQLSKGRPIIYFAKLFSYNMELTPHRKLIKIASLKELFHFDKKKYKNGVPKEKIFEKRENRYCS